MRRASTVRSATQSHRTLLTSSLTYDDIVLLTGTIKSYMEADAYTVEVRVTGSRHYVWDSLDQFLAQCTLVRRVKLLSMHVVSDCKRIDLDFRRRRTLLRVVGPEAERAQRYEREIKQFLMSARPKLWPSYIFFENPRLTVAMMSLFVAAGYWFDRNILTALLEIVVYGVCSVLWLNPNHIRLRTRQELRQDAEARFRRFVVTPIGVTGGLLGILSTGVVLAAHIK